MQRFNPNRTLIIIFVAIVFIAGGLLYIYNPEPIEFGETDQKPAACTMEAKLCPDGSYVGRTGPNCEFHCPGEDLCEGSDCPIPKDANFEDGTIDNTTDIQ